MAGPVAAARPLLLRPGSTTRLLKQLSGPAVFSTPSVPLSLRPSPARTFSTVRNAAQARRQQLTTCLAGRPMGHIQLRLYSADPSRPDGGSKPTPSSTASSSSTTSSPSSSPSSPSSPPATPGEEQKAAISQAQSQQAHPQETEQQRPQEQEQEQPPRPQDPSSSPPPPPPPPSNNEPELPSQADSRRSALSQNISHFMDNLQSRVLVASQTLNDLTGYSAIERIKASNAQLETDLARAQQDLRAARAHYQAVNARRAATQREVTTLLARKDTWAPADLERFTALYRTDHELEAAVHAAATALTDAEAHEARLSQALNSGILKRYHEEQIWSDRIRRQSTWGTWGLMGVNFLMFLILQFVAEPWRRRRLMKGIAAEEKAALDAVRRELEEVRGALGVLHQAAAADAAQAADDANANAAAADATEAAEEAKSGEEADAQASAAQAAFAEEAGVETASLAAEFGAPASAAASAVPGMSWKELLSDPSLWRPFLEDLQSERRIDLRMRDASLIALEGAVTGAAVVASIALLLARRS